jgi:hypothetical protein
MKMRRWGEAEFLHTLMHALMHVAGAATRYWQVYVGDLCCLQQRVVFCWLSGICLQAAVSSTPAARVCSPGCDRAAARFNNTKSCRAIQGQRYFCRLRPNLHIASLGTLIAPGRLLLPVCLQDEAGAEGGAKSAKAERDELLMALLVEQVLPRAADLYLSGPLQVGGRSTPLTAACALAANLPLVFACQTLVRT